MKSFALAVSQELARARELHAPIHSAHEGYSVILEELDEFWEEVRKRRSQRDPSRMYAELVQIAAMAQRTAEDVVTKALPAPVAGAPVGCAACDRGDFQLGHAEDCPKKETRAHA